MTDGDDNSSATTLQRAADIAQENQIIVYVLHTGSEYLKSKKAVQAMEWLTKATGGLYLPGNEQHIWESFMTIEKEIRSQYAIG